VLSLVALLPLLLASCSVLFVSPYDEVTARAATELVTKTETFLVRMSRHRRDGNDFVARKYDREASTFYNEGRVTTAAMLPRSEQKEKNEEEIRILRNLSSRYDQLEASHPNDQSSIL
jgi:hypothetical protein